MFCRCSVVFILLSAMTPLRAQLAVNVEQVSAAIERGIEAFRKGKLDIAAKEFKTATELDPTTINGHLYYGVAMLSQWNPTLHTPQNEENGRIAEEQFLTVIDLEPDNRSALQYLASMASSRRDFAKALDYYKRAAALKPVEREAFFNIAALCWQQTFQVIQEAKQRSGMSAQEPGPIRDPAVRAETRKTLGPVLEEGLDALKKALEVDPNYDDAMTYMGILIRQRAELAESPEDAQRQNTEADEWTNKAMQAKQRRPRAQQPQ